MRITILGSGTCVPSLKRSSCAVLVETDGEKLLFDVGAGTIRRLLEAGITVFDISTICLSHFHPDHSGELASFLFSNKYPDGSLRKNPLTLIAGPGLSLFYQSLKGLYGAWVDLGGGLFSLLEWQGATSEKQCIGGAELSACPMNHNPESLAFRVEDANGHAVVYSGDTDYTENLIDFSLDADLLICESALPDEMEVKGHLTPSKAGDIAQKARVGHLVLTHLYPETDAVDIVAQCRRTYDGPLTIAEDLMQVSLDQTTDSGLSFSRLMNS